MRRDRLQRQASDRTGADSPANMRGTRRQPARAHGLRSVIATTTRKNKLLAIGLIASIACSVVFNLLPPLVLKDVTDSLADKTPVLISTALLYFALLAISGLSDAAKEVMITVFGQKITHGLRSRMCQKISRLPVSYFTGNESGSITSRFVNDVDTVESLFENGIISMFTDCCKVIGILVAIWFLSRGLGLLMLIVTPLLFWLTRFFQRRMLSAQTANRIAIGKVNNHIPETIRNMRMITSLHRQRFMENRYDDYIKESYTAVDKSNLYDSTYSPIVIFTSAVIIAVMMVLSATGGDMQEFFGMSVGSAVAVIAYVGKVFLPLESIGMEIQNIQQAVAGVKRVNEFLDETERTMPDDSMELSDLMPTDGSTRENAAPSVETAVAAPATTSGKAAVAAPVPPSVKATDAAPMDVPVSFEDVDFSYEEGQPVLRGLSFSVQAGEKVTLMGRTGAGKSTTFKLILGLYDPERGQVRVLGKPASTIPDRLKREVFGYVEQDAQLVPGTIADQISLFDDAIPREKIEEVAQLVGLHDTIAALPDGYDTPCQESLFSKGQLQLLSIARAAVSDPPILLLDEITANLDSGTEALVMAALGRASANRTVISISHRLYEQGGTRVIAIG